MTDPLRAARARQLARLPDDQRPPAPRAALAMAKSKAYQVAADAPATLRAYAADLANALAFFAGVARQIVCDNLRSGITRACFYEPMVNRTYADMAMHYRTAVIPARPYKARDKAKVEVGVQLVQRWILARLRHRRFFSLSELNTAIRELLVQLNDRPMRGWGMTRRALYEQLDRPALLPLPSTSYEFAEWKRCRVNLDYHVEIERHYYSVPFQLLRQEVEARITAKTVEIFHRGKLVATHLRSLRRHRPSTVAEHMPSSHRRYRDWTHERIRREAAATSGWRRATAQNALTPRVRVPWQSAHAPTARCQPF